MADGDSLWDDIFQYVSKRVLWADQLAHPHIASLFCHIADLRQNERALGAITRRPPFFISGNRVESLCQPVATIGPPGTGKTTVPEVMYGSYLNPGILPDDIPSQFEGSITEAGYVGTFREAKAGEAPKAMPGLAEEFARGIVVFDEASSIFHAEEVKKNTWLVNNVMRSISDRFVTKRLGGGGIRHPTGITPVFGCQDGRMELTGGFARRVTPCLRYTTGRDMPILKKSMQRMGWIRTWEYEKEERERLRGRLTELMARFDPGSVVIPEETIEWLNEVCPSHTLLGMARRLLVGHAVGTGGEKRGGWDGGELVVEVDMLRNEPLVMRALADARKLAHMEFFVLFGVLRQYGAEGRSEGELWEEYRVVTANSRSRGEFKEQLKMMAREGYASRDMSTKKIHAATNADGEYEI